MHVFGWNLMPFFLNNKINFIYLLLIQKKCYANKSWGVKISLWGYYLLIIIGQLITFLIVVSDVLKIKKCFIRSYRPYSGSLDCTASFPFSILFKPASFRIQYNPRYSTISADYSKETKSKVTMVHSKSFPIMNLSTETKTSS